MKMAAFVKWELDILWLSVRKDSAVSLQLLNFFFNLCHSLCGSLSVHRLIFRSLQSSDWREKEPHPIVWSTQHRFNLDPNLPRRQTQKEFAVALREAGTPAQIVHCSLRLSAAQLHPPTCFWSIHITFLGVPSISSNLLPATHSVGWYQNCKHLQQPNSKSAFCALCTYRPYHGDNND